MTSNLEISLDNFDYHFKRFMIYDLRYDFVTLTVSDVDAFLVHATAVA